MTTIPGLLEREYGLAGDVQRLGGENENYQIDTPDGERVVLKLYAASARVRATFEHEIAARAGTALRDVRLPTTIPTLSGQLLADWPSAHGEPMLGRLLTYVDGTRWDHAPPAAAERLHDLGRVIALVDGALIGMRHPAAMESHPWDLTAAGQHRPSIKFVDDPARRRLVEHMFHLWAALAAPRFAELPRSIIHGDANDENILVTGDRVAGLIDFGDALDNPTVCDLAIALAYAMLRADDPLAAGAHVVAGYQSVRPLQALELEVLFPLVCGRLATSVVTAAERRRTNPDHPTWFITEVKAWQLIEQLAEVDPENARECLGGQTPICGKLAGISGVFHRSGSDPLVATRHRHISRALSISYRQPLNIVRGRGQYLYDAAGRPFLDLVNNVAHVGHCHPRVVEAGQRQMATLNTNTRYLYAQLSEYAERLTATLPAPLDVCFFVNSGSEANELALRLARTHTQRADVLVVGGAYHGNTSTLIAVSPYKFMGKGGAGAPQSWVHVVATPDTYRGRYRGEDARTAESYISDAIEVIRSSRTPIAAFLVESLMSCAGQIVPPPGYLKRVFQEMRAWGGVCIVDEVQVGLGRVGSHFWGFELHGVVPDIVVMGKPIGNGHPIGAVVTTRDIATSFENGMEFFSTFGGNPVSCAIGLSVLDVIRDEGLQMNAGMVGAHFTAGLRELATRHEVIGDVRGSGLFLGLELVRNRDSREPAMKAAAALVNRMRDRGVLLSTDGPFENVLKIKPPMVLTTDDVNTVLRSLDDELTVLNEAD